MILNFWEQLGYTHFVIRNRVTLRSLKLRNSCRAHLCLRTVLIELPQKVIYTWASKIEMAWFLYKWGINLWITLSGFSATRECGSMIKFKCKIRRNDNDERWKFKIFVSCVMYRLPLKLNVFSYKMKLCSIGTIGTKSSNFTTEIKIASEF